MPRSLRPLDLFLLSCLASGPSHGYQLVRLCLEKGVESGSGSSVYNSLHKLERRGLAEAAPSSSPNAPDRRTHRLTRRGRLFLQEGMAREAEAVREEALDYLRQYRERHALLVRMGEIRRFHAYGSRFRAQ